MITIDMYYHVIYFYDCIIFITVLTVVMELKVLDDLTSLTNPT